MLSIDGLVTGLDTTSIIEGLLEIQQQQIDKLQNREDGFAQQQTCGQLHIEGGRLALTPAGVEDNGWRLIKERLV